MTKLLKASKMPRLVYLFLAFLLLFSSIMPVVHVGAAGGDPFVTKNNGQLPSTPMSGIAYGNGTYVSVGYYGAIIKSTNGKDWVNVKTKADVNYTGVSNPSFFGFNSVAYGNGLFVAVGGDGVLLTSPDGVNWTQQISGTTEQLSKAYFSTFQGISAFYIATKGKYLTSQDGVNWSSVTPTGLNPTNRLTQIAVGENGTRLGVGDEQGNIYSTTDGTTWAKRQPLSPDGSGSIGTNMLTWMNDRYFISEPRGYIWTSTDLLTFTSVGPPFKQTAMQSDNQMFNGFYDGTHYYLFGYQSPLGYGAVYKSADAVNWQLQPFQKEFVAQMSFYNNGQYFRLGNEGLIMSENGSDWSYLWGGLFSDVIYDGAKYISAGKLGNEGTIWTSTNLSSWKEETIPNRIKALSAIAIGNGKYVAVGEWNNQAGSTSIVTSNDGLTWTTQTGLTDSSSFVDVAFGNGKFVAAGHGSSDPTLKISSDGITWSSPTTLSTNVKNFSSVNFVNGRFIALGSEFNNNGDVSDIAIRVSTDGTVWNDYEDSYPSSNEDLKDIIYDGTNYIVVAIDASYKTVVRTSPDLMNWSSPITLDGYLPYTHTLLGQKGSTVYLLANDSSDNYVVYATNDHGENWQYLTVDFSGQIPASLMSVGNEVIISGDQQLVKSTVTAAQQDSQLSQTSASFDKKASAQADVTVSLALNGNVFSGIKNGATQLQAGVDYEVTGGNTVTIKKEYLAQQGVGVSNLEFEFSGGQAQTLAVTVSDSTPQNSQLSQTSASFDKKASAQADVTVSLTLNGNVFSGIKNGATQLQAGVDYEVTGGNVVTIKKEYLAQRGIGVTNLEFEFSGGQAQTLAVTVSDSTPQNSGLSPISASFDKKASAQADVTVSLALNGNVFSGIKNGATQLQAGVDYEVTGGNTVTIKKEYLAQQGVGVSNLEFEFSGGQAQTLAVTVSDSTPQNSGLSQTTASFDKKASAQADVTVSLTLNGNVFSGIKNGANQLQAGIDYEVTGGNTVTIKKEYLAQQGIGVSNLEFEFSGGQAQTLFVNVTDSTESVGNPALLVPITSGDGQASLLWSPISGAIGYKVFVRTDAEPFSSELTTVASDVNSYDVTNLVNGTTYYFAVKVVYPEGDSAFSNEQSVTPGTVPGAPTGVSAAAGDKQAVVSFTAPLDQGGVPITGYQIRDLDGNIVATGTTSPITVSNLQNGRSYIFVVHAINQHGDSIASSQSNAVTPKAISNEGPVDSGGGGTTTPSTPTPSAPSTPSSPSTGITSPSTTTPVNSGAGVDILVNGKVEKIGTAVTTNNNNRFVTTITANQKLLEEKLEQQGNGAVITIPLTSQSDVVIGELNGQIVKQMEDKQAIVELKTDKATYKLPASQIQVAQLSKQFGSNIDLNNVKIQLETSVATSDQLALAKQAALTGGYSEVSSPLNFEVHAIYADQKLDITKFNIYVERSIVLPDGVDPNKITTGVVVEADGTVRHVPTKVTVDAGKYYATVNSLTNSIYSIIWNPIEFKDVTNHWAKSEVNNMGSRMVINGNGEGFFNPNDDITRAEFTAIVVRGLGLKLVKSNASFNDVKSNDWYERVIQTAYANDLINGFDEGSFKPNDKITREQAMTIIAKAMKITGLSKKLEAESRSNQLQAYHDVTQVAAWASQGVTDTLQAGIVTGRDATLLAPKAHTTRAEIAMMIQRLLKRSDLI